MQEDIYFDQTMSQSHLMSTASKLFEELHQFSNITDVRLKNLERDFKDKMEKLEKELLKKADFTYWYEFECPWWRRLMHKVGLLSIEELKFRYEDDRPFIHIK